MFIYCLFHITPSRVSPVFFLVVVQIMTNMAKVKRNSAPLNQARADEPLQRPVTPSSHRTSG